MAEMGNELVNQYYKQFDDKANRPAISSVFVYLILIYKKNSIQMVCYHLMVIIVKEQ